MPCLSSQHPVELGHSSPVTQGPELSEEKAYMSSSSHKTAEEDLTAHLFKKQNPCNILEKPETAIQLIPAQLPALWVML